MNIFDANNILKMESLNALFQFATQGILITTQAGEILKINPSALSLFGYKEEELINQKIEVLIPPRFAHSHVEKRETFHKSPTTRAMGKNIDLFALKKDGTEFPVEISLSYFTKDNENFAIAFIIDITERKKYHDSILQLTYSLEQKVEERTKILQTALVDLEASKQQLSESLEKEIELNEMKSRFVTMASHEFRTPLSTILSSTSLIGKYVTSDDDEKRQKHVGRIKSAVTNMTLILNDFLSASKLETGKFSNNPVLINIKQLVSEILAELSNVRKAGQEAIYTHNGIEECYVDQQIVRNILINLISNAIKFSSENKEIIIKTEITTICLNIEVTDNGIGIPTDEKVKLFERFFRAKNATNIQGTGLGLNIVSKYVEELGGEITFKSELEEGTSFYVTIPI